MFIWSYCPARRPRGKARLGTRTTTPIGAQPPNLEQLHQAAEEYPGTQMQQMADVTWADGQVCMASQNYIYNRPAANEALEQATSAYQGVIAIVGRRAAA